MAYSFQKLNSGQIYVVKDGRPMGTYSAADAKKNFGYGSNQATPIAPIVTQEQRNNGYNPVITNQATPAPATKAPDDPSNKYNTATGKLNPNYIDPNSKTEQKKQEPVKNTLAGDPDYEQLDTDNKSLVDYFDSILKSQDEQKKAAFQKSLDIAGQQADPYWKQKINIFKDEFSRAIGSIDADLASHEKNLISQKSEVERALSVGKEDLTIDQQAELAQEARNLDAYIITTRDNMAARGLTSSTIRTQAEQKLNEANQYVVEGKQRTYARNKRELEAKSAYNINEIERQIADVRRAANEEKVSTTRKAEGYLGSDTLSGTQNLMGGINGSIIEDKSADVLARAKALMI